MQRIIGAFFLTLVMAHAQAGTGEENYQAVCATCHAQGLAGAPKLGDKKTWARLIKEGQVMLTADGFNGVRTMPAKGGREEMTLPEFAATVVYMANQGGANWQNPDEGMLKKIKAQIDKRSIAQK